MVGPRVDNEFDIVTSDDIGKVVDHDAKAVRGIEEATTSFDILKTRMVVSNLEFFELRQMRRHRRLDSMPVPVN